MSIRVASIELEIGVCEVDGRLFMLNAHVNNGKVVDVSWYGTGIKSVSENDTFNLQEQVNIF